MPQNGNPRFHNKLGYCVSFFSLAKYKCSWVAGVEKSFLKIRIGFSGSLIFNWIQKSIKINIKLNHVKVRVAQNGQHSGEILSKPVSLWESFFTVVIRYFYTVTKFQGPIFEIFAKKVWELAILKNSVFFELAILDLFFNFFFASFLWKSVKGSWISRMGQNFDDYPDFQPKITHPKHFSRQCTRAKLGSIC